MLERITLVDFQKHVRLVVDLSPTVTTIVGRTEAGKSSVIRALTWLCQGGPAGGYVRHGADGCKVVLRVDGRTVARVRSKRENYYRLDGGEAYSAVGTNVPDDIARLLNVSEQSFQAQLDAPFLVCSSAGEVGRVLNRVVDLELIDRTLSALDSGLRKARERKEQAGEALQKASQEVEALAWVLAADAKLQALEGLQERYDAAEASSSRADMLRERMCASGHAASLIRQRAVKAAALADLAVRCRGAWEDEAKVFAGLAKLKRRPSEAPPKAVTDGLEALSKQVEKAREAEACAELLLRKMRRSQETLKESAHEASRLRRECEKSLSGSCPLCGRT